MQIPWAKPSFDGREVEYVREAVASTWISGGPFVDRFEREFCKRVGSRHGVAVSNGTTALQLALLALDVKPGDEVIVPGFTFVAPAAMVVAVGATPRFAEIDAETWCIDPRSIEALVTPRTRAVVAVHIYGNVCDLDAIRAITRAHDIALIEDAAEAVFSRYRGREAGATGELGCYSFQATKTITMGEGGFVATGDPVLHERMRLLRDHGMRKGKRYWHDVVGFNFRLTNLQAALGCAQLERVDQLIAARRRMFETYVARLRGIAGVTMQRFTDGAEPVVWAVGVRLDPKRFPARDDVIANLAAIGIETRPGFYPIPRLPPYEPVPLPTCERVSAEIICLPSHAALTEVEIEHVCQHLAAQRH